MEIHRGTRLARDGYKAKSTRMATRCGQLSTEALVLGLELRNPIHGVQKHVATRGAVQPLRLEGLLQLEDPETARNVFFSVSFPFFGGTL